LSPRARLARANVEKAGLTNRIELREQGFEALPDEKAFDLAWVPLPFIPERFIAPGVERVARALKPGGWVVLVFINPGQVDAVSAAQWGLTQAIFGGPQVTVAQIERLAQDQGLVDEKTLPPPPGVPVGITVGRKP
jgi:SAM-dependent methyltransferase